MTPKQSWAERQRKWQKKQEEAIAKAMEAATKRGVTTISAGGEATLLINRTGVKISHASIGGGATLEFIEKGTLPGIEALKS